LPEETTRGFAKYIPIALLLVAICIHAMAQQDIAPRLLPVPREYSGANVIPLQRGVTIINDGSPEDRFSAGDLSDWLQQLNIPTQRDRSAVSVELLRTSSRAAQRILDSAEVKIDPAMHEEGYAIVPTRKGTAVVADTPAGIFYGVQTVKQLIQGRGTEATLQAARIRDWPAMRYRGISDDLSRGPLPTLDFQKREIRTLAAYKLNVYSPYFENTLQYRSNPVPGLNGGSVTPEEARELVEYARSYHVMIIPEQEAFGHLHHVLKFEEYAALAETPMGNVLAPGQPGSLDLIAQWFKEIATIFPAPFLHIGADETADLGRGQTHAEVEARGLGPVYIDFLLQIHNKLAPLNRRLLFWGDVGMKDPSEVKRLPKDMIAVAWAYSPEENGFLPWLKPYSDAGMVTWVASGVNNWNRVYPDNDYALRNIQGFVRDGQSVGSTGMLNTIWNDDGEGLFQSDWYGVLFGAAAAWQPGSSDTAKFEDAYGSVFHGDNTGSINQAQRELITIYQMLDQANLGESTDFLYWVDPWSAEGQAVSSNLRPLAHEMRIHAERAITLVSQAKAAAGPLRETDALDALELGARRLDFIGQKFETADLIASLYTQMYAWKNDTDKARQINGTFYTISGANGLCEDLRDGYNYARLIYSDLWMRENRPYWLQNVLVRYDLAAQLWVQRSSQFRAAQAAWRTEHRLRAPAELGIPTQPTGQEK
jgi:hexosaminidase